MEILVEFDEKNWRISPDPAVVPSGTLVQWRFRSDSVDAKHLLWTVYFEQGHPFSISSETETHLSSNLALAKETSVGPGGQHVGVSSAVTADSPGHYKYGVRLQDTDDEDELGDEDPMIIVLATSK